jgi:hypothetical protein
MHIGIAKCLLLENCLSDGGTSRLVISVTGVSALLCGGGCVARIETAEQDVSERKPNTA